MIILNTPHNPVGKVFTKEELEGIAAVAEENNLLVMSDEVVSRLCATLACVRILILPAQYENLVFDGKQHFRIANLPGMWDRTVTVCSAGSQSFAFLSAIGSLIFSQRRSRQPAGALVTSSAHSPF